VPFGPVGLSVPHAQRVSLSYIEAGLMKSGNRVQGPERTGLALVRPRKGEL
jgi:hypothetical protein